MSDADTAATAVPTPAGNSAAGTVLELRAASKSFTSGDVQVPALVDVDLELSAGQVMVVNGPSGSGKSTLLHAVAGLEPLDSGAVIVDGVDIAALKPAEAARYRRSELGFVFQFFNLIPTLNVVENVSMPLILDGVSAKEADRRAGEMLAAVGLGDQLERFAAQMSGGQLQRVAVARALVANPKLVLADEPTGSLDRATGSEINDLLHETARDRGAALLIVSHDPGVARTGDHLLALRDGRVESRSVC